MKKKTKGFLMIALCLAALCVSVSVFAVAGSGWFEQPIPQPYGLSEEGTAQGSSFDHTYWLSNGNGDMLHFYVRNNGSCQVKILINDSVSATIDPGCGSYVTADLGRFSEKYTCHAYPVEHGAEFDIFWKCAIASSDS